MLVYMLVFVFASHPITKQKPIGICDSVHTLPQITSKSCLLLIFSKNRPWRPQTSKILRVTRILAYVFDCVVIFIVTVCNFIFTRKLFIYWNFCFCFHMISVYLEILIKFYSMNEKQFTLTEIEIIFNKQNNFLKESLKLYQKLWTEI